MFCKVHTSTLTNIVSDFVVRKQGLHVIYSAQVARWQDCLDKFTVSFKLFSLVMETFWSGIFVVSPGNIDRFSYSVWSLAKNYYLIYNRSK